MPIIVMNKYPYINAHLMTHLSAPNHRNEMENLLPTVRESPTTFKNIMKPDRLNIGPDQGKASGAGR